MKKKLNLLSLSFLLLLLTASANSAPLTVTYTADNIVNAWYEVDGMGYHYFSLGPNNGDWTTADTLDLDIEYGKTYVFVWSLSNYGGFSSGNPAGFLAELVFDGYSIVTNGVDWMVRYGGNPVWSEATSYGYNGTGIWGADAGGPIAGISTQAEWIWSDTNFEDGEMDNLLIKLAFTPVPEPATMVLFGLGLIGIAGISRKKLN